MVESFTLDKSFKYPTLYGDNARTLWIKKIFTKLQYKLDNGIIDRAKIDKYKAKIFEEYDVMCKQGMESFMLFMAELLEWCTENDIPYGTGRGSVAGSAIAYITDITDVDPIVWNTVFSRFCNADRISLGDVDVDFSGEDREKVYRYIIERFTPQRTAYIAAFSTLKDRGCIDVLAKGLDYKDLDKVAEIKAKFEEFYTAYSKIIQAEVNLEDLVEDKLIDSTSIDFDNHDVYIKRVNNNVMANKMIQLKHDYDNLISENSDLFYYLNGLKGTIIAKGNHPSGIIGSPVTIADNLGVFYKDGDINMPIATCAMKAVDSLNYVKFDILGLKTVGIIKDACRLAGIPYPKSHVMDWNDEKVWANMVEIAAGVFQYEASTYSFDLLKQFGPSTINHMSIVNAALRPSGKSYRDRLVAREFNTNPSEEIDKLLESNNGFLVFQEDTIKFLTDICDFSGSEADTIRRCVDEDTLVTMGDGTKAKIKDLRIGDSVLSVNNRGILEPKMVMNVFNNGIQDVYHVETVSGNKLVATGSHHVLTPWGWTTVNQLQAGLDHMYTFLHGHMLADSIVSISKAGQSHVYDIEVADNHNYIANDLIVHNCIGKKDHEALMAAMPAILEGYCKHSPKPKEIAEEEAKQFIQIIADSSEYQFG